MSPSYNPQISQIAQIFLDRLKEGCRDPCSFVNLDCLLAT